MAQALFDINADGGDQGFSATNSQVLALRLRQQPPLGVSTVLFQVFDPAGFNPDLGIAANPPRASLDAPALTVVGDTSGPSASPASVGGSVTITMPAAGRHSYIVRCLVNGGMRTLPNGQQVIDPTLVHERGVFIPTLVGAARKVVCTELRQFSDGGWADALDNLVPASDGRQIAEATPTVTGAVAAADGDMIENVQLASAPITRTLPTTVKTDQFVYFSDTLGKAGQFPITIAAGGANHIDDGTTHVLDKPYQTAAFKRIAGGDWVNFADGRQFRGTDLGKYMSGASGLIRTAIVNALAKEPNEKKLILPAGDWSFSQISEASGGLHDNLIFDGVDALRCRLFRDTAGGGFIWFNSAQNIVFKNITFDVVNVDANFNSMLAFAGIGKHITIENCRFLCSIPNTATDDGIRHQVLVDSSLNVVVRNSYFYRSQLKLCGTGGTADGAEAFDNEFEDCNDLGISVVSGNGSGLYVKNVKICRNRFYGNLIGSGFIYVGDDADVTPTQTVQDILIADNICTGAIGQMGTDASKPASRTGIYVVLGDANKRIKLKGNIIANSNPTYSTGLVRGLLVFLRNGTAGATEDVEVSDNAIDFRSDDTHEGIFIDGPSMTGVRVQRNVMEPGSRGLTVGSCSDSQITENIVRGSTSAGLIVSSARNAVTDLHIRGNKLDAQGAFGSSIQFSGSNNISRCRVEQNRLVTATGSAAVSGLTGGATLEFRSNLNSMSAGYHASATPTGTPVGDVIE